jgi:hypothetical protein
LLKIFSGIETNFKRNRRKNISGGFGVFFMSMTGEDKRGCEKYADYRQLNYFDEVFCRFNLTALGAVVVCMCMVKDSGSLIYGKNNRERNTNR